MLATNANDAFMIRQYEATIIPMFTKKALYYSDIWFDVPVQESGATLVVPRKVFP